MDIRVLRYFLAVAREENITRAAENLHIAQPTLSKQLMELEQELGKKLLLRGKRKVLLTEDGILLRKRAEEIVMLLEKTKSEIASGTQEISGEISIGGVPTDTVLRAASVLRGIHPNIRFRFFSGDATAVTERLDHGSLDFAILITPVDTQKYEYIPLPEASYWGLLMEKENPLAELPGITKEILCSVPLVIHQRSGLQREIALWAETEIEQLKIAATYNVVQGNAFSFVKSGLGYLLAARDLLAPDMDKNCCFRPLTPSLPIQYALVWKRYPVFGKAAEAFLEKVKLVSDDIKKSEV